MRIIVSSKHPKKLLLTSPFLVALIAKSQAAMRSSKSASLAFLACNSSITVSLSNHPFVLSSITIYTLIRNVNRTIKWVVHTSSKASIAHHSLCNIPVPLCLGRAASPLSLPRFSYLSPLFLFRAIYFTISMSSYLTSHSKSLSSFSALLLLSLFFLTETAIIIPELCVFLHETRATNSEEKCKMCNARLHKSRRRKPISITTMRAEMRYRNDPHITERKNWRDKLRDRWEFMKINFFRGYRIKNV